MEIGFRLGLFYGDNIAHSYTDGDENIDESICDIEQNDQFISNQNIMPNYLQFEILGKKSKLFQIKILYAKLLSIKVFIRKIIFLINLI